jgi:hypothetical protein
MFLRVYIYIYIGGRLYDEGIMNSAIEPFGAQHVKSYCLLANRDSLQSRDRSVGIALGYGLDDRGSRVRFPVGAGYFSLHHRVQNGSGAHPASYPIGAWGSFPGCKVAGA